MKQINIPSFWKENYCLVLRNADTGALSDGRGRKGILRPGKGDLSPSKFPNPMKKLGKRGGNIT